VILRTTQPDVDAIASRLREVGVERAEELAKLAAPSIRIDARRCVPSSIPLGASRFGGSPDLPPGFEWPCNGGNALSFIAQIDLSALQVADLPETGWLFFFYDYALQPWGFDPKDAGGAHVAYWNGPREALSRVAHPTTKDNEGFEACSLTFSATTNLPDVWDRLAEDLGASERGHREAYSAVAEALSGIDEDALDHHFLGHPQLVQNDMRGECQLVADGIYCGDPSGYQSERAKELLRDVSDWRLLLQVDTDEEGPGWMWGDTGRIYFWIRRQDLAARMFERSWLILQCG